MTTGQVTIRRAATADEDKVLELVERLVEFGPPAWRNAEQMVIVDKRRIAAALQAQGEDPKVMVATLGGEVAGFVHVHSLKDHYRDAPHGHVSDIVVAPAHEGHGVGRLLLDAARAWATEQGFQWLTISVFEDNRRAAEMYERAGFGRDVLRLVQPLR
ncbi:GNAT family N-acetyltransferase [Pseudomonas sp. RIT-PI-S]|uniref:GNAT family N-acetyltransferase n=1 Tax=Pseudomonas sp. RIT-PI-S TaxID=3035295 RepID=UPI0021D9C9C2|nr:GNAT family N-acetyltransferase [Pseudomonas sp. RIT-PI-S]